MSRFVCICMYDNEILEFFVCICVENQSVGTLLFHYLLYDMTVFAFCFVMGQVFKLGCATGLTAGKILVVSDPYFDVESTEVGDFAMRGDSGSLIVCTLKDGTNYAIGVISVFEAKRKIVRCVMLKYAYQI